MSKVTVGPFTWARVWDSKDECWDLVKPTSELSGTAFCLKDYGNHHELETNPFSGWRLVSGGPFTQVGRWASFDEAVKAVVPFLTAYYRERVQERLAQAQALATALNELLPTLEA